MIIIPEMYLQIQRNRFDIVKFKVTWKSVVMVEAGAWYIHKWKPILFSFLELHHSNN